MTDRLIVRRGYIQSVKTLTEGGIIKINGHVM